MKSTMFFDSHGALATTLHKAKTNVCGVVGVNTSPSASLLFPGANGNKIWRWCSDDEVEIGAKPRSVRALSRSADFEDDLDFEDGVDDDEDEVKGRMKSLAGCSTLWLWLHSASKAFSEKYVPLGLSSPVVTHTNGKAASQARARTTSRTERRDLMAGW